MAKLITSPQSNRVSTQPTLPQAVHFRCAEISRQSQSGRSRRVGLRMLAGAIAASTLTGSVKAAGVLAGVADPIFAMLEEHRRLQTLRCDLYDDLDGAEYEAGKEHGRRPVPLTNWRNYYIGECEIDANSFCAMQRSIRQSSNGNISTPRPACEQLGPQGKRGMSARGWQ